MNGWPLDPVAGSPVNQVEKGIWLLFLCFTTLTSVMAQPASVASTNLGNGLFRYTFSMGDDPMVWGLSSVDGGRIQIEAPGALEVTSPPGWTATVWSNQTVSLEVTQLLYFLEEPVTFNLRSCIAAEAHYDLSSFSGLIVATAYSYPEHTYLARGYQSFSYVGPAPFPSLAVRRQGTDLFVEWPTNYTGFNLEMTPDLTQPTNWFAVSQTQVVNQTNWSVLVSGTNLRGFYRLRKDCNP